MLTKGAIGNLINRYRAVLKKCNLINAFGSLVVASMLVMGGAGVASAETIITSETGGGMSNVDKRDDFFLDENGVTSFKDDSLIITSAQNAIATYGNMNVTAGTISLTTTQGGNGLYTEYPSADTTASHLTVNVTERLEIDSTGHGINSGTSNGGSSIIINGNNAEIKIKAAENAVVARGGDKGHIEITGKTVTLESTGTGESEGNEAKGHGIYAQGANSKIDIKATESLTVKAIKGKYGVYADTSTDIDLNGGKNTSITGRVLAFANDTADDVSISVDILGQNISIDANGARGVQASGSYDGGDSVKIVIGDKNTNNVEIKNASFGLYAQYKGSSVDVNFENLIINSSDAGIFAGNSSDSGDTESNPYSVVNVNTKNTEITSGEIGIWALSKGTVNVDGNLKVIAPEAIQARGNSTVNINESGENKVQITGDIVFANTKDSALDNEWTGVNANVNINLSTEDSFLNGNIYYSDAGENYSDTQYVKGMALGLSNGATWSTSKDSFVNDLSINDGNVNVAAEAAISVGNVTGNGGNINFVDATKLGSFTAAKAAAETKLNVQAIDEAGNVKNADQVSKGTLETMIDQVEGVENLTASATDGIVNAGYKIDSEGNIVSGGGASSVTKAVLEAASVNTVALDKILTNDVRKRLGDIRSDANTTGVWMRWDGGKLKGNGLTNDFNTIQIGGDTKVGKNCRLGVAGSFTHGDSEFDRGNGQLEGFSFAAYSTWMGENGMFADVVARLGHFSTEMNVEGHTGDMDNRVFSLSGEYGWRFNVCEQFFIEPQVELAYTYVNSEDLQLGDARFAFDSVDSLTGRLGLVAGWNLPNDMGNVYARASVLQQFMGDAKVTGYSGVGPTIHKTDGDDTWVEYGIGANIKLTDKTYIWADVERTEGADIEEEWRGTVGIRYSF